MSEHTPPSKPLTEDRLRDAERRLSDVIDRFDAGFTHEVSDERAALNDIVAEVRRIRALFSDPEADAALLERANLDIERQGWEDDSGVMAPRITELAARLRSLREP